MNEQWHSNTLVPHSWTCVYALFLTSTQIVSLLQCWFSLSCLCSLALFLQHPCRQAFPWQGCIPSPLFMMQLHSCLLPSITICPLQGQILFDLAWEPLSPVDWVTTMMLYQAVICGQVDVFTCILEEDKPWRISLIIQCAGIFLRPKKTHSLGHNNLQWTALVFEGSLHFQWIGTNSVLTNKLLW